MEKKKMNKYKIGLIYCLVTLTVFSVMWGIQILVLLGGWYSLCGIVLFILHKKGKPIKNVVLTMFFYPLFVIFTKFLMANNVIGYEYLNRLEHFLFSFVTSFIIWNGLISEKLYLRILLVIGIVNLIGISNEFLEFVIREIWGFDEQFAMWVYQDTIIDLFINLLASVVFCLIVNTKKILNIIELTFIKY